MQVTDPVCGMKIDSEKAAARETRQDKNYYFCSELCRDKFRAAPERYAEHPINGGQDPRRQ
jgi:Cu+-exporting ATPase